MLLTLPSSCRWLLHPTSPCLYFVAAVDDDASLDFCLAGRYIMLSSILLSMYFLSVRWCMLLFLLPVVSFWSPEMLSKFFTSPAYVFRVQSCLSLSCVILNTFMPSRSAVVYYVRDALCCIRLLRLLRFPRSSNLFDHVTAFYPWLPVVFCRSALLLAFVNFSYVPVVPLGYTIGAFTVT